MTKLLIISPHFSTGGAPAVTLNKVELLKEIFDIMVIEYSFLSWQFVVQRERTMNLLGDRFRTLGDNKNELISIIEDFKPNVISMEEFPEMFMDSKIVDWVYRVDRDYEIVETTHDSSFKPSSKVYTPDKFVFVSAFNCLKYSHLQVPQHIVEYPVDYKNQNKKEAKEKLQLDPNYKHVVIIGLFTPRKNQKYAFEIGEKTKDYNIKYHFIGNQAENFRTYWQPLMEYKEEKKLDNCVVWGERGDVDDFINAADLFLFPSKGDRNNKELNPIVIKEAMQYNDLPKLMYNLDVYLDKYDRDKVHYLTGDLDSDANKLIEIVGAKSKSEEIIIVGTYPNLKSRVELTKATINSLRPLKRKILLVSHYPVDESIQRMVDFYIYDAHNPLCHHSYYNRFFRSTFDYHVEVNINGLKNANQSLTVLTNIYNATKFISSLNYKSFFYTTYDVVLNEKDISTIEHGFTQLDSKNAYLGSLNTPFGKGIQTNGMFFRVPFFLDTFDDVRNPLEYNHACEKQNSQNFLEDYFVKKVTSKEGVEIIHNQEETLLKHSGLGVASNSEYYSILPIKNSHNGYMLYFYTYNIDDRKVGIVMREDGVEFYNGSFKISKSNEFKKDFEYNKREIEIEISFHDGDNVYKVEKFLLNESNIDLYKNTGSYISKKKPKIKLVHIQTTINDEREKISRESISQVEKYGIEYILHTNEPYKDLPPQNNCIRPQCVSMELFDEDRVKSLGTALTPAHYGCYEAFKYAILNEFDDCDFLIVCEGDCIIEVDIERFCNVAFEVATLCEDNNVGFFSFGDTHTLEHGWLQSKVVQDIPNQDLMFITDHIIGIQSIMFPKFVKKWLKESFRLHKWDAADIFLNTIFKKSSYKMGILKKRLTTQANGYSLIDKQEKIFL